MSVLASLVASSCLFSDVSSSVYAVCMCVWMEGGERECLEDGERERLDFEIQKRTQVCQIILERMKKVWGETKVPSFKFILYNSILVFFTLHRTRRGKCGAKSSLCTRIGLTLHRMMKRKVKVWGEEGIGLTLHRMMKRKVKVWGEEGKSVLRFTE